MCLTYTEYLSKSLSVLTVTFKTQFIVRFKLGPQNASETFYRAAVSNYIHNIAL